MSRRTKSIGIYLVIAGTTLGARSLLVQMPAAAVASFESTLLGWLPLAVLLLLGLAAVYFTPHVGFPDVIHPEKSWRELLLAPALVGMESGLGLILWDLAFRLPENLNIPFPQSIPYYYTSAVVVEIALHLLPLVFLLFSGRLLLRGQRADTVLWLSVLVVAALEPLFLFNGIFSSGFGPDFYIAGLAVVYAINLVQLVYFSRSGFLAMLVIRLGLYLVWHILWGSLRLWLLF
jgi:hypothetical protein